MKESTLSKRDAFLNVVVVATVIEADEKSTHEKCGFEVGDKLIFTGTEILGKGKDGKEFPGTACYSALFPLLSNIFVMEHGGRFPWEAPTCITACPDAENRVVFSMKRYDKRTGQEIPPEKAHLYYFSAVTPEKAIKSTGKKRKYLLKTPKDSPLGHMLAGRPDK